MRLAEIAFLVQIRHDVADGGGAEAIPAAARNGTRGDGFAAGYVGFDDLMQNFQAARRHKFSELAEALHGRTPARPASFSMFHYRMELFTSAPQPVRGLLTWMEYDAAARPSVAGAN